MKNLFQLIVLIVCIQFYACAPVEVKPPNIIFIMADDLGWADVGYNGEKFYETPAIDSLANMGMRFNRFYPGGPNCAPSRACILTGMYSPRTHIYTPGMESKGDVSKMRWNVPCRKRDNDEHLLDSRESVEPEVESVAEVLKKSGYVCASIGKWHIGEDTQGFDYWSEDGRLHSPKKFKYFVDTTVAEDMT
ncbi:MAG: sulfatase-like hydrolase/transferase, partial [Bacteroidales bacterium]|nr:sulfatase-like hydrolase/transferase [Bacteroidales bacterium]